MVAEALIRKAVIGDLQAMKEIADRVEGKVSEARCNELAGPVQLIVVRGGRAPGDQKRGIDSPQAQVKHIEST